MGVWLTDANRGAYNAPTGALSGLITKGGNHAPYTGYPGYSKRSNRSTLLPAALPTQLSFYESCIFQLYSAGLSWSPTRAYNQNGWWAPDLQITMNSVTTHSISGIYAIINMGSGSCKVSGLYSGGYSSGGYGSYYGGSSSPARLERIRIEGITGVYVAIESAADVSNPNILGTYNSVFINSGYMDVISTTKVYIIGTNR